MEKSTRKFNKIPIYILLICICLYGVQIIFHAAAKSETIDEIVILGFHDVVKDDEKETYYKNNMWVESISSFEAKIKYLYDNGYKTLTLDQLKQWKDGTLEIDNKTIVLTFDDGYYASSYLIAPLLEKYGYTASTFVVGGSIHEGEHTWDASSLQYMNLEDMKDQHVMKYYSHTYNMHGKENGKFILDVRTKEEMQKDINQQTEIVDTSYFAYPFGHYNDTIIDVLKQNNVKLAFGYNENRKAKRTDDNYKLTRFAVTSFTNLETFKAMLES